MDEVKDHASTDPATLMLECRSNFLLSAVRSHPIDAEDECVLDLLARLSAAESERDLLRSRETARIIAMRTALLEARRLVASLGRNPFSDFENRMAAFRAAAKSISNS